jgi:hypothetical protein
LEEEEHEAHEEAVADAWEENLAKPGRNAAAVRLLGLDRELLVGHRVLLQEVWVI